jgi:hypothetical protein
MMESYAAAMLWRLENQDVRTQRQVDERVGHVVYALRSAVGRVTSRTATVRRVERDARATAVTG